MWLLILLHVLGLNVCQADGQENSTKMFYFKLEIDESAIGNITELLRPFVNSTEFHVDDVKKTTICQNVAAGTLCTCEPHFRWSKKVCEKFQKCCDSDECIFPEKNSSHACVSNTSVVINGSITTAILEHLDCLKPKNNDFYEVCNENITTEMKQIWSTLRGFDMLNILSYRVGSIIVDFEVTVAGEVTQEDLIDRSKNLAKTLQGSIILETTGFVQLTMPPNPVEYKSQHNVKCRTQDDLGTELRWQLTRDGQTFNITDGTESDLTTETLETEIALKNITEVWAGEYSCIYRQAAEKYTISHIARAELDVCLIPSITTYREPQFILCKNTTVARVKVKCEMSNSNEKYEVNWSSGNVVTLQPTSEASVSGRISVYEADAIVKCDSNTAWVTCKFTNRCNQSNSANITIEKISANDKYCEAEGEWGNTKSGFTAQLRCKDLAGTRKRACKGEQWQTPVDECVNLKLSDTLESAKIVDIGVGELDKNTAKVFSQLENVTNNTASINSGANVRTSIDIISTLSCKNLRLKQTKVVDDFLESSSNMLERSLSNSWKPSAGQDDETPAEKYLQSVEALINKTDFSASSTKRNMDLDFSNCSRDPCVNSVFNVTIELSGRDPGTVKTAGFKELQMYLPINDTDLEPNSIVVSTTANSTDSLQIKMNFQLQKQRPHNVEIHCVAWDSAARRWSTSGCEWGGPSNEGLCTCTHLSSFAILMSRHPLEIPLISEITKAGLSVSIISLTISLIIELIVWNAVVKTNTLYLRHTAHVNIIICLLVADCCFLASSEPKSISDTWCQTFVVLKHFCYLAMFFWMLCLSITLLHQAVFLFHSVSKKTYLRISLLLGYVCPLLIVAITFLTNKSGASDSYFSRDTCWLVYSGTLRGSIHTFIIPVGIIVFINVFSMVVVIMKLLDHPKNTQKSSETEKKAAITVVRSVVLLTPIFGVTWLFGFAVLLVDLTSGKVAYAVNYAFTLLNAFQGLFILCTTCLGDKLTRDALLNRLKPKAPASTSNDTSRTDASWKK